MSETFPELPRGVGASARGLLISAVFVFTFLAGILHWALRSAESSSWSVRAFFDRHDPPKASWDSIQSGEYTQKLEAWLKVDAPPIVMLGSQVKTLSWVLGVEGNIGVVDRPGDWTFFGETLEELDLEVDRELRRALLEGFGARARKLGVEFLVIAGPDKSRVYDDLAFEGAGIPPSRARYLEVLGEDCEKAGLQFLDPTEEMKRLRVLYPSERIYLRRDTHWLPIGATRVAAMADELLQFEREGSIARPILWQRQLYAPADLYQTWRGLDEKGFLGKRFRERHHFTWTHANDPAGVQPDQFGVRVPEAPLLVAGDSFTAQGFVQGLYARLPVPVDGSLVRANSNPYENMHEALRLVESGRSKARAIIVLGVERLFRKVPRSLARRPG